MPARQELNFRILTYLKKQKSLAAVKHTAAKDSAVKYKKTTNRQTILSV